MAVSFGLVVPSAKPTRDDDGLVPVGVAVTAVEELRRDLLAEEHARPAGLTPAPPGMLADQVARSFGRHLELPLLAEAGLSLITARVSAEGADVPVAVLAYGDPREGASVWLGLAEDVGQFAVHDLHGQLEPLHDGEIVGDLGNSAEASVFAWRADGMLWILLGEDAALLTQVLAQADAPGRAVEPGR